MAERQIVTIAAPAKRKPREIQVRLQCTTDPLDHAIAMWGKRPFSARIESIVCSILGRPASQKTKFLLAWPKRDSASEHPFRTPPQRTRSELDVPYPSHYRIRDPNEPRFLSSASLAGAHEGQRYAMSRRCELTGKSAQVGHKVSHSNIKTKRRFLPNLINVTMISDTLGRTVKLRVSANALRSVDHRGGLDAFLTKARAAELSPRALDLKRQIAKKLALAS